MSDTSAGPPPTIIDKAKSCCSRFGVFAYDLIVVFLLLLAGLIYVKYPSYFPFDPLEVKISVHAMWFGALGGIVISLKGVYDHSCAHGDWDDAYDYWHFGRPISGALTGLITLVLLLAINPKEPNQPIVYAIAFIFGTQESRFFNFLFEVAALVVRVPNDEKNTELKGIDIQPSEGKDGAIVLITGHGFAKGATVTLGANKLANVVVSKDGATIVGTLPAGTAGAAVDVTIANPTGERIVLPGKFTYTA